MGVLDGEPGGLGDLGRRRRGRAGGERRRLVGRPVLEGLRWRRGRWGSTGRGGRGRRGRGSGERRQMLAAVRRGGRSRGRGGERAVDGGSELRRPVRLTDGARICWRGGVPERLQGG